MGIKNFYRHFKKKFGTCIVQNCPVQHDILILELNGIFYDCTKRYMLSKMIQKQKPQIKNLELFEMIGDEIFFLIEKFLPKEKVFLAVDGFAPLMKFREQFQRRQKNAICNFYDGLFDLNQYTPGTKFMDFLTKYIDWIIKKKMNENVDRLKDIHIFFSNEKNRGEGEYKSIQFLLKQENEYKTICIYSNDSDWIQLSLLLPLSKYEIYICRNKYDKYEYIDINRYKNQLKEYFFDKNSMISYIDMYILFLFLGNDYIESFNYLDTFDLIFEMVLPLYRNSKMHLIHTNSFQLDVKSYIDFIKLCFKQIPSFSNSSKKSIQYQEYRNIYYYFYSIQNLVNMSLHSGTFDWNFVDFSKIDLSILNFVDLDSFIQYQVNSKSIIEKESDPIDDCLFHLMILLPPESQHLLPKCLGHCPRMAYDKLLFDKTKNKFIFDFKLQHFSEMKLFYFKQRENLSYEERKRNQEGKIFEYYFNDRKQTFLKSFYGMIKRNKIEVKCF